MNTQEVVEVLETLQAGVGDKWGIALSEAIKTLKAKKAPREMSVEEIDRVLDDYNVSARNGLAQAIHSAQPKDTEKLQQRIEELERVLKNLIFTATKLWDEVKNIKDGKYFKVTHPIIEEAKQALKDKE